MSQNCPYISQKLGALSFRRWGEWPFCPPPPHLAYRPALACENVGSRQPKNRPYFVFLSRIKNNSESAGANNVS